MSNKILHLFYTNNNQKELFKLKTDSQTVDFLNQPLDNFQNIFSTQDSVYPAHRISRWTWREPIKNNLSEYLYSSNASYSRETPAINTFSYLYAYNIFPNLSEDQANFFLQLQNCYEFNLDQYKLNYSNEKIFISFVPPVSVSQPLGMSILSVGSNIELVDTKNDLPVFSNFSKDIYNCFSQTIHQKAVIDEFEEKDINFTSNNSFAYVANSTTLYYQNPNLNFSFSSQDLIDTIIDSEDYPSRTKVIKVPSFTKKATDTKIDFAFYTKSQLKKRKTFLFPILQKTKFIDDSGEFKDCYIFKFLLNCNVYEIRNYKNQSAKFKELALLLFQENGLGLTNPELYQEKLNERLKNLNTFSNQHLINLDAHQIEVLANISSPDLNVFDSFQQKVALAKPKVNNKLKTKYSKLSSFMEENQKSIQDFNFYEFSSDIKNTKNRIQRIKEEILFQEKKLVEEKNNLLNHINSYSDSFEYIVQNNNIYKTIKKTYLQEISQAMKNNLFDQDLFLFNMSKNDVDLLSISYQEKSTNKKFTLDSNTTEENIDFIQAIVNKNYKIKEVQFITTKPSTISVVGKTLKVFGGPYVVKVTSSELHIKLASPNSLFGVNNSRFYVHPHSGNVSFENLFSYTRACLGEASSLIWKAFNENDLKKIILSSLTWVKSANSSDPWGKNYVYFPDEIKDLDNFQKESILTTSEVEDFLSTELISDPLPELNSEIETINSTDILTQVTNDQNVLPLPIENILQEDQQLTNYTRYSPVT